jgi:hypothetical protein
METTTELFIEPSAVVVGIPDDVLTLCHEFLPPAGLRIYRAADPHLAGDAIVTLLPRLVIVPAAMRSADLDMLEDCAAAVGAIVLHLDPTHGYELLGEQLHLTVQDLRKAYARRAN